MNKKLVFGTGVLAATFVLWACSSDESNPGVPSTDDGGGDTATSTDTGTTPDASKPEAANTQDANFDADTIDAPEVNIDYSATCPAFTKCDSNPVGKWKTTGGCVSSTLFDDAKSNCPGIAESAVTIKAKGIVDITATNVSRQAKISIGAHIQLPKSCAMGAPCSLVPVALKQAQYGGFDTATCSDDGTNCQCDVTKIITDASGDTYTNDNAGTLTTGAGEKYDFCVTAGVLTYRKADSAGTQEPATFTAAP